MSTKLQLQQLCTWTEQRLHTETGRRTRVEKKQRSKKAAENHTDEPGADGSFDWLLALQKLTEEVMICLLFAVDWC